MLTVHVTNDQIRAIRVLRDQGVASPVSDPDIVGQVIGDARLIRVSAPMGVLPVSIEKVEMWNSKKSQLDHLLSVSPDRVFRLWIRARSS